MKNKIAVILLSAVLGAFQLHAQESSAVLAAFKAALKSNPSNSPQLLRAQILSNPLMAAALVQAAIEESNGTKEAIIAIVQVACGAAPAQYANIVGAAVLASPVNAPAVVVAAIEIFGGKSATAETVANITESACKSAPLQSAEIVGAAVLAAPKVAEAAVRSAIQVIGGNTANPDQVVDIVKEACKAAPSQVENIQNVAQSMVPSAATQIQAAVTQVKSDPAFVAQAAKEAVSGDVLSFPAGDNSSSDASAGATDGGQSGNDLIPIVPPVDPSPVTNVNPPNPPNPPN